MSNLSMKRAFLVTVLAATSACSSGQNSDCRWPDEPARLLNLDIDADSKHLIRDIELVEELSVRFADASSLGPGPIKQQYRIEHCYQPLMSALTARHGVSMDDVLAAQSRIGERGLNLVVNGPVALFFLVATLIALRWTRRRFAADERIATLCAIAVASVAIPAVTVGAGRIWEAISETIRVGNGHLGGQRGLRLPWVRHSPEYYLIAVILFLLIAMIHYRRDARRHKEQIG